MLSRTNQLSLSLALLAVLGCESQSTGAGDVLVVAVVEISPPELSLVAGATGVLVATPKTSSGIVIPNRRPTWSSDDLGIASVSQDGLVTGVATGTTSVHATIDDIRGTITVEVSPRAVASVTLAPPQLNLRVGEAGDLIATARDADGEAIPGRQITFSSDNPFIATVSETGHVTGVATGLTVITATVEGKSGTANVSVTSLPATQLEFQNQPATGAAGAPIPAVRIEVQNDQGGMVTEGNVPVTMALADNPTGAVLSGSLTVGAVNGVATFNDLRINQAGVGYSLRASAGELEPALSAAFTIVAGSASRLAIATQPSQTAKSGEPLAVQPTIQIRDAGGNAVASAGVEVTAVLEGSGATLGGTRTVTTNAQGLATFTDLVVAGTAAPYTLLFAAPGLTAVASNIVTLKAGAPASLALVQQPAATTESGVTLLRQPVLQLLDQEGNVIAEPGISVTAAIQSGGGVLNGSLTVLTGTDGRASFTNLSIGGLIGTRVLRFTSGALPPVTSEPIVVHAGPAAALIITHQPPTSSVSGDVLSPAPVIQVTDAFDNPVDPLQEISVAATIATGTAGSLSGTTSVTTIAGVATFSGLALIGPSGPFTLRFASGTLTPVVSQTVTIGAGPPAALAIVTQPSPTVESGTVLARQPVVQVRDASGVPSSTSGVEVIVSIASGGGTVGGTTTKSTDASGRATFTDLVITGTGPHTLRFAASGLTGVTSDPIDVTAPPPSALQITTQPSPTAVSGIALTTQPVLRLVNTAGDPVPGATIAATINSGPVGGTLGNASAVTDANGVATFSGLAITGDAGPYTLRFTSGTLSVVSAVITIRPVPAKLLLATAPSGTTTSGAAFLTQPAVQIADANGAALAEGGTPISAEIASGPAGARVDNASATTNASGLATFSGLAITGPVGSYVLRFVSGSLTPVSSGTIVLSAGAPATVTIPVEPPASAVNGVALSGSTVVRVQDGSGTNAAGVTVTASLASGGGQLSGTLSRVTAADGRATFDDLVLTGATGPYTLRFSVPGGASVVSRAITLTAGAPASLSITTQPATTAVSGVPLSPQPVVQLRDQSGNAVARSGIVIAATIASGGGTLGGTTTRTTGANGQASFTDLEITGAAGPRTLGFSATGLTGVTSGTITVGVGSASSITIPVQPPTTAVNGVSFSGDPVVQVQDAGGSNLAGVAITAAVASGDGALQGTLTRTTGPDGRATFNDLRLVGTAGSYTLRFTAAGGLSVVSRAISLAAGAAESLSITTQPATSAVSGVPLSRQPVVQLRDQSGNAVARSGIPITATIASGGGTLGGTTTRTTGANGQASFTDLEITGSPGPRTLGFSATGLTGVTSGTITVGVGSASSITIPVQPPTTAVNDVELSGDVVVLVQDAGGNNLAGVSVAASVASGNGAVQGTLARVTGSDGRATFSDLKLVGVAGSYTLRFAAGGLSVVSRAITLAAGAGTQLSITTQPSTSVESGDVLARQPVIQVRDQSGNASADGGVAVTVSIASGGGTLGGTTTRTTGANGQATFTDLEITGSPGPRTLRFSATGLTGVTSATVNVTAPVATRLLLATQPASSAVSGAALSTQPSVQVADANGVAVAQAGTTITAVIASGPGGAPSLLNATAVTNDAGRATFSGLAIRGLVGVYTLRFQAGSLTPVTSTSITLAAGSPASITISTQPPTNALSGDELVGNSVVLVRDASGNNVPGASVTASVASGNGQLQGTVTRTTASNGQATFDNLALVGPTGTYTLRFSVAGVSVVSRAISLENLEGQILFILTQPPSDAEKNKAFTRDPRLEIRDANGNRVEVDAVSVTAELVTISGSGSLGGDTVRETNNGVVTFANLKINGTGTFRIRFTTPGRGSATSNIIDVR